MKERHITRAPVMGFLVLCSVFAINSCWLFQVSAFPDDPKPFTVSPPVMTPGGGRIGHAVPVTLSSAGSGDTIVYTLDGSIPIMSGATILNGVPYAGPITLPYGTTTVNAIATNPRGRNSSIATGTFTQFVFAYSGNQGSNNVIASQINLADGSLSFTGSYPTPSARIVAADPAGRYLYVSNPLSTNVSGFAIDPLTGALTPVPGQPFSVGAWQPFSVAVERTGQYVFAAANANPLIRMFTIAQATGTLAGGFTQVISAPPGGITTHPTLDYLYAAIPGAPGHVEGYSINLGGATISPVPGSPFALVGTGTVAVVVDPTGRFLYAMNQGSSTVTTFSINPGNGSLTNNGNIPVGATPISAAIDPSGRYLYIADMLMARVWVFTINTSTGALTPAGFSLTGSSPQSVSIEPSGKWLYTANFGANTASAFLIDPTTGALTPSGSFGQGVNPISVATSGTAQ